jgi:hypothetical protein
LGRHKEAIEFISSEICPEGVEVDVMIAAGCQGVTVSEQSLWDYVPQ